MSSTDSHVGFARHETSADVTDKLVVEAGAGMNTKLQHD